MLFKVTARMFIARKQTMTARKMYYGWDGDSGVIKMKLISSLHFQRLRDPHNIRCQQRTQHMEHNSDRGCIDSIQLERAVKSQNPESVCGSGQSNHSFHEPKNRAVAPITFLPRQRSMTLGSYLPLHICFVALVDLDVQV